MWVNLTFLMHNKTRKFLNLNLLDKVLPENNES